MKIAICNNRERDISIVQEHIKRFAAPYDPELQIDSFVKTEDLLTSCKENSYPVIFTNFTPENMTCVDVICEIKKMSSHSKIIFTATNFDRNNPETEEIHYLELVGSEKIKRNFTNHNEEKKEGVIVIAAGKNKIKIYVTDIFYVEVFANTSMIHTKNDTVKTYMPLVEIEQMVGVNFLRSHRSYLVNMDYILKVYSQEFLMATGDTLPISKNKRKEIKERYMQYILSR